MADFSASSAGWRRLLSKTSSMSLTEAVTATHDFKVAGYSLLDGVGVGKHVSSCIFSAGGCHWIVRFYPDGCRENDVGAPCSSVSLHLLWGAMDVRVKYNLGVLRKDGTAFWPVNHFATDIFEAPSDNRGYPNFVVKSWLKKSSCSCLDNDCLTIRCVLTVIKGSHTEDVDMNSVVRHVWSVSKIVGPICAKFWHYQNFVTKLVAHGLTKFRQQQEVDRQRAGDFSKVFAACQTPAKFGKPEVVTFKPTRPSAASLHQHLKDMLKSGEGTDVKFSVGGLLLHAHKCVLAARSPVFNAEFFGPMKETATGCIQIDDMEPWIFEALLHFIYTDSLPDSCKGGQDAVMMQHLLVAADLYEVDRLRLICETKLSETIDVDSVAATLALAEQHHCSQLRRACIGFMASPEMLGAVMRTDGFRHLVASCPLVMEQILDKVSRVWGDHSR